MTRATILLCLFAVQLSYCAHACGDYGGYKLINCIVYGDDGQVLANDSVQVIKKDRTYWAKTDSQGRLNIAITYDIKRHARNGRPKYFLRSTDRVVSIASRNSTVRFKVERRTKGPMKTEHGEVRFREQAWKWTQHASQQV